MRCIKSTFEYILNFIIVHLFIGVIWLNNTYGHTTGEEKVFHLLIPLDGVNSVYYKSYILTAIIPTIIVAAILMFLIIKSKKKIWIYIPLVIISLCFGFNQLDLSKYLYGNLVNSSFIEENYVDPAKTKIDFSTKKNVVYIILESMENTYSSKEYGGAMENNLIPQLTKLSEENISFSNTKKLGGGLYLDGSNFTVASMLAQTSGMTLKINIDLISKYDFKKFYTGATLGDILYENGYDNYIIMGSNAKYGARDTLYKNHHYSISDVNTAIEKGKMTKDDIVWWGYNDNDLFKYAKEELQEISKKNKPFNYTILTVDTHFEDGYLEDNCKNKFKDQYSNVIYCSDSMIYEFVEWLKEQDFYKDTVVIMVGDHISMDTDFFNKISKKYERTTYNVFINTDYNKNNIKMTERHFTQLDMLPTTISAIGGNVDGNRLGLGTNLFSNEKTIVEKYGYEKVKDELLKKSKYYNTFMGKK